ncbi:MAG: MFS transporter [Treponema sp.]|jgi:MFS family permease|nr:MFS transporter [Treponema sp.]
MQKNIDLMFEKETNKEAALLIICLASFVDPFMGSAINLSLPQIANSFLMGAVSQSWIATIYLISTAIFQVPFARLADLIGRKKVFLAGLIISGLSTLLCGLSTSSIMLIITRRLSGLGSAMKFGTSMAILVSLFPSKNRGKAIGINTAATFFALSSGPFLGGVITDYFGWRSLFYIVGMYGVIVALLSIIILKTEWTESKGADFDYYGSIIYALGLSRLIIGFSKLPDVVGFVMLAVGTISFVVFTFLELKNEHPVFNVRIFVENKVFGLSCVSALINYASTSAITFMMSLYLQYIRGFAPKNAGMMLIIQACVQCVVSLYAGRLSDRMNPSKIVTIGMGIISVGLIGLGFVTPHTAMAFIAFLLFALGLGFGLFSSTNANIIMSSVDKKYYGQASATMGTMRLTGQSLSMGIATMVIALFVGDKALTPELHSNFMKSFHSLFILFAVLCATGTYMSSFRRINPED